MQFRVTCQVNNNRILTFRGFLSLFEVLDTFLEWIPWIASSSDNVKEDSWCSDMSASLKDIHRQETEFLEVTEANGSSLSTDRFCTPSATSGGDTTTAVLVGKSVVGDRGKELHSSVSTLLSFPKVCCKASVNISVGREVPTCVYIWNFWVCQRLCPHMTT